MADSAFPYVRSIKSNVKGGVDRPLGPRMVFTGPNGAGKSAIINSIELALTGTASDVVGRPYLAREIDLLQLAPEGNPPLDCLAVLSDGAECRYVIPAGASKGKAKRAVHTVPALFDTAGVFPLRGIKEATAGSVDTQRRWWLQQVGAITDAEIRVLIPEALQGYYTRAVTTCLANTPPVDKLLAALGHARQMVRTQRSEARAAAKASTDAGQGLAAPPAAGEVEALRTEHRAIMTKLGDLHAAAQLQGQAVAKAASQQAAKDRLAHALASREDAQRLVAVQEAEVALAHAEVTRLRASRPAWKDKAIELILALDAAEAPALGGVCPCCGAECLDHGNDDLFMQRLHERAYDLRQQLAASNVLQTQREGLDKAQAILLAARSQLENLKLDAQLTEGGVTAAQRQLTEASVLDAYGEAPKVEGDPAELRARAQVLSDQIAAAEAAEASWKASKSAADQGLAKKRASEEWSDLVEACQGAVDRLLGGRVQGFVAEVRKFLPPADAFDLVLQDGVREVCAFGLRRGATLHTALSGGEWARVLAAIAAAKVARAPGKLALIIPEDRAWDAATLGKFLQAVQAVPAQVIVATTVDLGSVEGWTVERIGGVL